MQAILIRFSSRRSACFFAVGQWADDVIPQIRARFYQRAGSLESVGAMGNGSGPLGWVPGVHCICRAACSRRQVLSLRVYSGQHNPL